MRIMILSFSEKWYPQLINGEKIYEHRKRFCDEPVMAYIYLGVPRRQLVAIVELGKREKLSDWLIKYQDDIEAIERIKDYLSRNQYAMPIKSIQKIEPIDMRKMEQDIPGFRVPISYMFLDDKPDLLEYIEKHTHVIGKKRINNFSMITSKNICLC